MFLALRSVLVAVLGWTIICARYAVEINIVIIAKLANVNHLIEVIHIIELAIILSIDSLLIWLWYLIWNVLNVILGNHIDVSSSSWSNVYFCTCWSVFALHLGPNFWWIVLATHLRLDAIWGSKRTFKSLRGFYLILVLIYYSLICKIWNILPISMTLILLLTNQGVIIIEMVQNRTYLISILCTAVLILSVLPIHSHDIIWSLVLLASSSCSGICTNEIGWTQNVRYLLLVLLLRQYVIDLTAFGLQIIDFLLLRTVSFVIVLSYQFLGILHIVWEYLVK